MSHAARKQDMDPTQIPPAQERQNPPVDLPVGEILRRARVHYKLSLADVEKALRIKSIQLEAIETGHAENLPARVYAIGFVRSYAQYLGLDSDYIVKLFKAQGVESAPKPDLQFPVSAEQSSFPSWWIILVSVLLLLIVPTAMWQMSEGDSSESAIENTVPEISEDLKEAASIDMEVETNTASAIHTPSGESPVEENAVVLPDVPKQQGVILTIKENSWVEIRGAGGKRLVSRVLKAGDQYFVPDRPDLTMSVGNAAGVEISVDGQILSSLGERGKVIRNIPLNAEKLKTLEKER